MGRIPIIAWFLQIHVLYLESAEHNLKHIPQYSYVDQFLSHHEIEIISDELIPPHRLQIHPYKQTAILRSRALLLDVFNGTSFLRGTISCPAVAIASSKTLLGYKSWEYYAESPVCKPIQNPVILRQENSVMSFAIPWGDIFSHIVATMLPKLHMSCALLSRNYDIKIIVNSELAKSLLCEACKQACLSKVDRFIIHTNHSIAIQAHHLYLPLFIANEGDIRYQKQRSNVADIPSNTIPCLNVAVPPSSIAVRSVLFMPRPRNTWRHVMNEKEMLLAVCNALSAKSGLQLNIFKSSLNYNTDRLHSALSSARVILSPHGTVYTQYTHPLSARILINLYILTHTHTNKKVAPWRI